MFKEGQKVIVGCTDEIGAVAKVDYRYNQVEVKYPDGTFQVVGFNKIRRVEDE
ncbi:hypothetical protein [Bacillus atrophaeus]|uniref:hypothetical protein n=1 Tax=Bacillus atrophaeus TaxID=1452 RepID=UPI00227EA569|nr:hypothetical protein [Bacillus atrophaeus]MCY8513741.1 hypothetical protein [Bacillus atrophaeus]MCY8993455.1 hypothetical protein [Bacillus atrophaeus]